MNMQRVQETLGKVGGRNLSSSTEALQEGLEYIAGEDDQIPYAGYAQGLIERELEKRQNKENIAIAKTNLFWQKVGIIVSVIAAFIAILIAIYLKK
ncbi:MAG: hypothetical protein NTZ73_01545 [Candidatus Diapherotrites archaeon]|nr:hypothetical protein [Candidatus Diapherotrites archaeon]